MKLRQRIIGQLAKVAHLVAGTDGFLAAPHQSGLLSLPFLMAAISITLASYLTLDWALAGFILAPPCCCGTL